MLDDGSDGSASRGSPAKSVIPGVVLVLSALAENALWGDSGLTVWKLVLTAVPIGVAVGLRHKNPSGALFVVAAVIMAQSLATPASRTTPILLSYLTALALMAYYAGYVNATRAADAVRAAPWRPAAILTAATAVVSVAVAATVARIDAWLFGVAMLAVFGLVPWLLGRDRSRQRQLVRAGWSQVAQLEREQHIIEQQTRLTERARIAQDMHDSLGHELSLIALRAGAMEIAPNLDERHRAVFGELRSDVLAATERLAQIIGVLSDETEPPSDDPARDDVHHLVERARASGMTIGLRVRGEDRRPPVMVERATYRVLQESLTNAAKHAPGAAVEVDIAHSGTETVVTVRNDRPAGVPPAPTFRGQNGQNGQNGLRERARLLGGTLEAGPREGAYQVTAWLPHGGRDTRGVS